MMPEQVNCRKCIYYYITWEYGRPHGCKAFGFKGRQMPSLVVFQSSGKACQAYSEKPDSSERSEYKRPNM